MVEDEPRERHLHQRLLGAAARALVVLPPCLVLALFAGWQAGLLALGGSFLLLACCFAAERRDGGLVECAARLAVAGAAAGLAAPLLLVAVTHAGRPEESLATLDAWGAGHPLVEGLMLGLLLGLLAPAYGAPFYLRTRTDRAPVVAIGWALAVLLAVVPVAAAGQPGKAPVDLRLAAGLALLAALAIAAASPRLERLARRLDPAAARPAERDPRPALALALLLGAGGLVGAAGHLGPPRAPRRGWSPRVGTLLVVDRSEAWRALLAVDEAQARHRARTGRHAGNLGALVRDGLPAELADGLVGEAPLRLVVTPAGHLWSAGVDDLPTGRTIGRTGGALAPTPRDHDELDDDHDPATWEAERIVLDRPRASSWELEAVR